MCVMCVCGGGGFLSVFLSSSFFPVLSSSLAIRRPENAKQIYFHKLSVMAFAIMVHLIALFYWDFIWIFYFGLLQPQWTRPGDMKEREAGRKVNRKTGREK